MSLSPDERMRRIDAQLAHVWMVRTFLKHAEESEEDEAVRDVVRELYDYCLALGPAWKARDAAGYLKLARKKLSRLRHASEEFARLQPEVSTHTNFQMAAASLQTAVAEVVRLLDAEDPP